MARKHRSALLFLALLLCALGITFYKIPIASSQGLQMASKWVEGDLPVEDPSSPLWKNATAVEIPLSAQNVTKPFLLESKIKSVTVSSLHNDTQNVFLVEWVDSTQHESTVKVDDFRDAVAMQFPQVSVLPFYCMGHRAGMSISGIGRPLAG